jgi:capsular polysaccharide biosynthesis protein
MIVAVGLLAATVVSTSLAFVRDYLDPAFRTPDEVVAFLDAPVLASLPRDGDRYRGLRILP